MNSITLRGTSGDIRYVYHRAAVVGAWTIESGHLRATLLSHDAFHLSQQPLSFTVYRPHGVTWTWRLADVSVTGTELHGTITEDTA